MGDTNKAYRDSFFSRLKIRTKLISIISLIIVISLAGMIILATIFFRTDNAIRVNESNLKIAEIVSQKMETDFSAMVEKLNVMGTTMIQQFRSSKQKRLFTDLFFTNDKNLLYVGIVEKSGESGLRYKNYVYNKSYFKENRLKVSDINKISNSNKLPLTRSFNAEAVVQNVSSSFKTPVIMISLPFQKTGRGKVKTIIISYLKLEKLLRAFKTSGIIESFMVDGKGDIIAHPDSKIVLSHGNYINLPIVDKMLKSKLDNGQRRYKDDKGEIKIGSFKKIAFGGLGIIATVDEDKAFQAVYNIQERNILIAIIAITLAILIVYFFGKTITTPIVKLLGATHQIEEGQFRVDIQPKSGDEIGQLTESFVAMGLGLEEREKMKDAFGKFVNKEIAEQVLKGEIKLGGE
ncbi:cache and HAMP domain-containing protein, partial [Spirochaetota bacterium]